MKKILLLIACCSLIVGCAKAVPLTKEEKAKKEIEKTLNEAMGAAQNKKGYLDLKQIQVYKNIGEEFTLQFQTRDYKNGWDNPITGSGQASYKITSYKDIVGDIGVWQAKQGNKFMAVYLEVKGDPVNAGQPSSFEQTGSDPAPIFYVVDKDGKQHSQQAAESGSLAFKERLKSLMTSRINTADWIKSVIVFQVAQNIASPVLVIKNKTGENQYQYLGIKLY